MTARKLTVGALCVLLAVGGFAIIQGCGGGKKTEQTKTTPEQGESTMTQEADTTGASESTGSESMESKPQKSMPDEGREEVMALAGYACPMHPEETSLEPGTCSVCGMALEPAKLHYVCPMHPEETSLEPGKCSICDMDLVLRPVDMKGGQGEMGH